VNSQGIRSGSLGGRLLGATINANKSTFISLAALLYFPLTRAFFAPFFDWKITPRQPQRKLLTGDIVFCVVVLGEDQIVLILRA
jgi:hypothetical protein